MEVFFLKVEHQLLFLFWLIFVGFLDQLLNFSCLSFVFLFTFDRFLLDLGKKGQSVRVKS